MKAKLLLCSLIFVVSAAVQGENTATFRNPVMPGYNPDPSICRVGGDYYMTTSSFTWYPGLPIYHSRDLVNWELIGHALDRPDKVRMEGLDDNDGTWAATIRYHEGTFYIITTASKSGGNFYMTATDPCGPWSDPVWLNDAPGIDPSLFFDDDGRCYYTGNRWDFHKSWPGQSGVWIQQLDVKQGRLVGERMMIAYGHAGNAKYAEGPHLYKVDGHYLLLMAEGGSGRNHAVVALHSDSLFGTYVADQINPVLTHRHLGKDFPITNIGHADLVQTQGGEWYAVALGNRMSSGLSTLGRETFLCKVDFENGTPIFNKGYGRVLDTMERPPLPTSTFKTMPFHEDFDGTELPLGWYFVRIPQKPFHRLTDGALELSLLPNVIDSLTNSAMILRKIPDLCYSATARLSFNAKKANEQAGLVLYRTANGYFTLMKGRDCLTLVRKRLGRKDTLATVQYKGSDVTLRVEANGGHARFLYSDDSSTWHGIGEEVSLDAIADNKVNKFNGTGIGLYATSNKKDTKAKAKFDWFDYERSKP